MLVNVLTLTAGGVLGFVASRRLRRPEGSARAGSVVRNVGGTLGRRRGLSAPELQRACFSEMVRHARVTRQGRTLVPARFVIRLHPDDLAVVDESRRWFTEGLADALRQATSDHGWILEGPVDITVEADPSRRSGVPDARPFGVTPPNSAAPEPGPAGATTPRTRAATDPASRTLVLVRTDTGERIPLLGLPVTVGRSRDRDITVDDKRVSRSHARIEPRQGGWTVVDDGSANGTRLDGRTLPPHEPRPLRPGAVVTVGPVELRVSTGGGAGEAGTRALDDRDRHRISGEVLPADRRPPR